jgi:uncharacterized protein (DUF1697 family)
MNSIKYLALLRGINVGGNNIIKMTYLKKCFEKMGFSDVVTYIQSGNVIFETDVRDSVRLCNQIEKELSVRFKYTSKIALLTYDQLKTIIDDAPDGFGNKPDEYRYDVMFLIDNTDPHIVIKDLKIKDGVDTAIAGNHSIYFSRLISKATQSQLKSIIALPVYQRITIRNWNTTYKLYTIIAKKISV